VRVTRGILGRNEIEFGIPGDVVRSVQGHALARGISTVPSVIEMRRGTRADFESAFRSGKGKPATATRDTAHPYAYTAWVHHRSSESPVQIMPLMTQPASVHVSITTQASTASNTAGIATFDAWILESVPRQTSAPTVYHMPSLTTAISVFASNSTAATSVKSMLVSATRLVRPVTGRIKTNVLRVNRSLT
jgi:hypothetical protein